MPGFQRDDATAEEIEREREVYGGLAQQLRELADACIRTEADEDTVREVTAQLEHLTARLRARQVDGAYGIKFDADGHGRPWGNAVVGVRNPIAPPLDVEREKVGEDGGRAWADFELGAAYEGPPDLVHGGVSALVLDQLLGEACGAGERPGMTGTLQVRYLRPTPLGKLHGEAWIERVDGIKTVARGTIGDADGPCVEAEGLFILPRWARDRQRERAHDRFE